MPVVPMLARLPFYLRYVSTPFVSVAISPETREQLAYQQTLPTHASMQTNTALVALPSTHKTLRVIDVPGHPRIRDQFQEHLPDAKGIVFVVDASTVSRNGAAVAEYVAYHAIHAYRSVNGELPLQTSSSYFARTDVAPAITRGALTGYRRAQMRPAQGHRNSCLGTARNHPRTNHSRA